MNVISGDKSLVNDSKPHPSDTDREDALFNINVRDGTVSCGCRNTNLTGLSGEDDVNVND